MASGGVTVVYDLLEVVAVVPVDGDAGWCPICSLPSGVTIYLASQIRGRAMMLTARTRCDECGHTLS